jgi:hypothetical protein
MDAHLGAQDATEERLGLICAGGAVRIGLAVIDAPRSSRPTVDCLGNVVSATTANGCSGMGIARPGEQHRPSTPRLKATITTTVVVRTL